MCKRKRNRYSLNARLLTTITLVAGAFIQSSGPASQSNAVKRNPLSWVAGSSPRRLKTATLTNAERLFTLQAREPAHTSGNSQHSHKCRCGIHFSLVALDATLLLTNGVEHPTQRRRTNPDILRRSHSHTKSTRSCASSLGFVQASQNGVTNTFFLSAHNFNNFTAQLARDATSVVEIRQFSHFHTIQQLCCAIHCTA